MHILRVPVLQVNSKKAYLLTLFDKGDYWKDSFITYNSFCSAITSIIIKFYDLAHCQR